MTTTYNRRCNDCNTRFDAEDMQFTCPACNEAKQRKDALPYVAGTRLYKLRYDGNSIPYAEINIVAKVRPATDWQKKKTGGSEIKLEGETYFHTYAGLPSGQWFATIDDLQGCARRKAAARIVKLEAELQALSMLVAGMEIQVR